MTAVLTHCIGDCISLLAEHKGNHDEQSKDGKRKDNVKKNSHAASSSGFGHRLVLDIVMTAFGTGKCDIVKIIAGIGFGVSVHAEEFRIINKVFQTAAARLFVV